MPASLRHAMSSPATKPCLAAALVFAALAVLIARFAVAPLATSDLLGIGACAAAAGAAATLAFTLRQPASRPAASAIPTLDTAALATQIAAAVDTRLAASADHRRDELLRAASAASTQPANIPDTDAITAPAGAKPRLGRGLLGLMHAPSAITSPLPPSGTAPAADLNDTRAAA